MARAALTSSALDARIHAVRRFSRFYTQTIGVLEDYLHSSLSLSEMRVLYELAHHPAAPTASELARELNLDAGYLSRILRRFERQGFLKRTLSAADARQSLLTLTAKGQAKFAPLEARSHAEVGNLIGKLTLADQERLVKAMHTIEHVLGAPAESRVPYVLRPHRPGDMGWVVAQHGALYAQEYGWTAQFEALVAGIIAAFIEDYDVERERCWIAEMDGVNVGSVFVVRASKTVAKLRLLLIDPKARGLGLGARLVDECIRFARDAGYKKLVLWTQSNLFAARRIYEKAGFVRTGSEPHHSFGHDLIAETWERKL